MSTTFGLFTRADYSDVCGAILFLVFFLCDVSLQGKGVL